MKKMRLLSIILLSLMLSPFNLFTKTEVYFSPTDHPTTKLINLIKNTKKRIHAAIYMFTAKPIAEAVADAKKRGIDVQIIIDKVSYESVFGKGKMLKNSGINTWVYQAKDKASYPSKNPHGGFMPLMHNKFAILDEKVWTGSFNWTHAANSNNCENVIVTDDPVVCKRYLNHFQDLKQKCKQANVARPSRSYYDSIKEAVRQLLETVNKRK